MSLSLRCCEVDSAVQERGMQCQVGQVEGYRFCAWRRPLVPPAKMVAGWLSSDGHCAGIMSSEWRDFGLAMYSNPNSFYGSYWALEFGVPL